VYVWKQKLDGDTLNTNISVDDLIKMRKLFVWRGKNNYDVPFTKESVSKDGKQFTLNKFTEDHDKRDGLMSVVQAIDNSVFFPSKHVFVNDKIISSDKLRNTQRTIEQLIKDGDLFVCDEIIEQTASVSRDTGPRFKTAMYHPPGHVVVDGGKRKKSRKPKRRNSRSNRTLNKSKK